MDHCTRSKCRKDSTKNSVVRSLVLQLMKSSMYSPCCRGRLRACVLAAAAVLGLSEPADAEQLGWDFQPYRVRAVVALDLPGGIAEQISSELPEFLRRRVDAAMGQMWSFEVSLADGADRKRILSDLRTLQQTPPKEFPLEGADKLVLIAIRQKDGEYLLTAREFDGYVQRWGTPIVRRTQQTEAILEQAFGVLCRSVAPLAQIELDPNDEKRVVLKPRGAALVQPTSEETWTTAGEVFLPFLRRTSRGGKVIDGGIQQVPWTFVEVAVSDGADTIGHIQSGTRRPFGVRKQGRVEQVAIALRGDPADLALRLHSRTDKDKPLVGYEVLVQSDVKKVEKNRGLKRIGSTDRDGIFVIAPGNERILVLFLRNGGQLLARLPVVPGSQSQIDVPLPDDDARLAAEARLAAMREDLIDIVARRNILMARARQKIDNEDFAGAQKLILQINELPGRAQLNLELQTAAQRLRSNDPQIQRRIDRLFEGTQTALTQYLDGRPIDELTNELRSAQQKGT
jgi:hypothetical protein